MGVLNDLSIRKALIRKLSTSAVKPKAIIEELRVHNGNAIADVVALYKDAHCYEIKGDGDKIERLNSQGSFYELSFRKVTIVTTQKHLSKTKKLVPKHWGILLAKQDGDKITLKYARGAKVNPNFHKHLALLTLWKDEMLQLLDTTKSHKTKNRDFLAKLISQQNKKQELSESICQTLVSRYSSTLGNQLRKDA